MTYDEVLRQWAGDILKGLNQPYREITFVYVDIGRNDCYGFHGEDDYCECDTSSWIELNIRHKTSGGVNYTTATWDDPQVFARELFERAQKSATTHSLGS